jgi:hypothetical protein
MADLISDFFEAIGEQEIRREGIKQEEVPEISQNKLKM